MLSADDRRRVAVVLVRARNPNNIGAVARAMHDFGFGELRLVSDYAVPLETARSAVDAGAVLRDAVPSRELSEATAACTLVLGTTAVGDRALDHPLETLQTAGERVAAHLRADADHRVGLLFGSEKTGLSNEELSHCHALVTIPMEPHVGVRHASMNLGQAAAVCLYELVRDRPLAHASPAPKAASAEEVDRLRALFDEVLRKSGYTRRHPANSEEARVRRLLLRARPPAKDVPVWIGVMRQILWRMRDGAAEEAETGAAAEGETGAARGDTGADVE